jgi:hypothetical protein
MQSTQQPPRLVRWLLKLARLDETVSSEEETEGRLAQLSFDDWLDR